MCLLLKPRNLGRLRYRRPIGFTSTPRQAGSLPDNFTVKKKQPAHNELPIIQLTYDLIRWYVPVLNQLPRQHKFLLADRVIIGLYEVLEQLIQARYADKKQSRLTAVNTKLDVLRYQTRLLLDFGLLTSQRYQHAAQLINEIGAQLGGWLNWLKQEQPGLPA